MLVLENFKTYRMKQFNPEEYTLVVARVVHLFQKLATFMPTDLIPNDYDANRHGGYLAIGKNKQLIKLERVGNITHTHDPDFITKDQKYIQFALQKMFSLLYVSDRFTLDAMFSESTVNGKLGGLQLPFGTDTGDHVVVAFSGHTAFVDQAIVVLVAQHLKYLGGELACHNSTDIIAEKTHNPYLQEEFREIFLKKIGE